MFFCDSSSNMVDSSPISDAENARNKRKGLRSILQNYSSTTVEKVT